MNNSINKNQEFNTHLVESNSFINKPIARGFLQQSVVTTVDNSQSLLLSMPTLIFSKLFSYLETTDICNFANTCMLARHIVFTRDIPKKLSIVFFQQKTNCIIELATRKSATEITEYMQNFCNPNKQTIQNIISEKSTNYLATYIFHNLNLSLATSKYYKLAKITTFASHTRGFVQKISDNGRHIVCIDEDFNLEIRQNNRQTFSVFKPKVKLNGDACNAIFSNDSKSLAVIGKLKKTIIYSLEADNSWQEKIVIPYDDKNNIKVKEITFSNNSKTLIINLNDQTIKMYDKLADNSWVENQTINKLFNDKIVFSVISHNSNYLLIMCQAIKIIFLENNPITGWSKNQTIIEFFSHHIAPKFSDDDKSLAVVCTIGTKIFTLCKDGYWREYIRISDNQLVLSISFCLNNSCLQIRYFEKKISLCHINMQNDWDKMYKLDILDNAIRSKPIFSPNNQNIALYNDKNKLIIFGIDDSNAWSIHATFDTGKKESSPKFSGDSNYLATISNKNNLHIFQKISAKNWQLIYHEKNINFIMPFSFNVTDNHFIAIIEAKILEIFYFNANGQRQVKATIKNNEDIVSASLFNTEKNLLHLSYKNNTETIWRLQPIELATSTPTATTSTRA